jgi:hypothetical protein
MHDANTVDDMTKKCFEASNQVNTKPIENLRLALADTYLFGTLMIGMIWR